jgi:hypothetical protein
MEDMSVSIGVYKRRGFNYGVSVGKLKTYVFGNDINVDQFYQSGGSEYQETFSQGNPVSLIGKGLDIGGVFISKRAQTTGGYGLYNLQGHSGGASDWTYFGPLAPYVLNFTTSPSSFIVHSAANVLDAFGTTAISRMLPTNPLVGMGQFLGELRDLPKPVDIRGWKTIVRNFRNETKKISFDHISRKAAGEYLNHVFGWVPFVSDIHKFVKTVRKSVPEFEKYQNGSGKLLRRTYHFPDIFETTTETLSTTAYPQPSLPSYFWSQAGTLTKTTQKVTKRWCTAAFTYYLPVVEQDANSFVQGIQRFKVGEARANKLYGLRLTPDLLWKLTPWSWAVDWVTNAGDVVRNWQAFANDGLVMRHAYIMESIIQTETWNLTGVGSSAGPINLSQTRVSESKVRQRATPYGFGVNPDSFSAKQWSIIAALGISKHPLSLNF